MKITMKDIAKRLNVSINAVSIALNDKPGVSDEMRLQILRTADEMGYINQKKQYLSIFSKSNICVLMQSYYANTGHFYSIVLCSIVEQAKNFGYFSILNYFEDNDFHMPECMLTDYVVLKGYKTIGFFGDLDYSFSFQDRFMGYKQALIQNQIVSSEEVDSYIEEHSFLHNIEKYILANEITEIVKILKSKKLPEVLICANDSNAFAVISALKDMGLKQITTVQVQKELMGQVAVSNLMDRIHRKENTPMTQLLSVKIVERASLKL